MIFFATFELAICFQTSVSVACEPTVIVLLLFEECDLTNNIDRINIMMIITPRLNHFLGFLFIVAISLFRIYFTVMAMLKNVTDLRFKYFNDISLL